MDTVHLVARVLLACCLLGAVFLAIHQHGRPAPSFNAWRTLSAVAVEAVLVGLAIDWSCP